MKKRVFYFFFAGLGFFLCNRVEILLNFLYRDFFPTILLPNIFFVLFGGRLLLYLKEAKDIFYTHECILKSLKIKMDLYIFLLCCNLRFFFKQKSH